MNIRILLANDEINTTDLDSVKIEAIDPKNVQSDKTVCFDEIKNSDSNSDEIENHVFDSDEIKNTASQSFKSKVSDTLPGERTFCKCCRQ